VITLSWLIEVIVSFLADYQMMELKLFSTSKEKFEKNSLKKNQNNSYISSSN
jgi:hypothetical protein